VYQDFATVDLLSNGRAEIMAGRGSFIESFPLFGYDLEEYDDLFQEKLLLLMKLQESEKITWSGRHRAELKNLGVYPRAVQTKMPIWIAVGGTPQSAVRAAVLGLPMALAIIGGEPDRFTPFVDLVSQYRRRTSNGIRPRCRSVSILTAILLKMHRRREMSIILRMRR
jgi:alkanesulfonate monooxygenase SsuD/methylene tetrahydromethanopterin reductase-like flavin-dependent oxidoreductase (luciferase family)